MGLCTFLTPRLAERCSRASQGPTRPKATRVAAHSAAGHGAKLALVAAAVLCPGAGAASRDARQAHAAGHRQVEGVEGGLVGDDAHVGGQRVAGQVHLGRR